MQKVVRYISRVVVPQLFFAFLLVHRENVIGIVFKVLPVGECNAFTLRTCFDECEAVSEHVRVCGDWFLCGENSYRYMGIKSFLFSRDKILSVRIGIGNAIAIIMPMYGYKILLRIGEKNRN